jgi:hypothetical protein
MCGGGRDERARAPWAASGAAVASETGEWGGIDSGHLGFCFYMQGIYVGCDGPRWAERTRLYTASVRHSAVRSGYRGIGDRGRCIVPVPARPDGDKFSPVFFLVGIKFSPSPSLNREIPCGKSGIGPRCHLYFGGPSPSSRVPI